MFHHSPSRRLLVCSLRDVVASRPTHASMCHQTCITVTNMATPAGLLLAGSARHSVLRIHVLCTALLLLTQAAAGGAAGGGATSQRPMGWLSGFTKDGREYWYHPDNPRDVRMQDAAPKVAPPAPPPQPKPPAPAKAPVEAVSATAQDENVLPAAQQAAPVPKGLLSGLLESFTGRGTKDTVRGTDPAAESANSGTFTGDRSASPRSAPTGPPRDRPPGHYDAFGNLKEIVPKHAVHEAVASSVACTDDTKSYVGGAMERKRRCVKKVRKAVQSGAPIDEPDPASGQTALMASVLGRHSIAVQALLEAGAVATLRHTKSGLTALDIAADKGYAEVVDAILQLKNTAHDQAALREAMVALSPADGLAPIHRACAGETRGHAEVRLASTPLVVHCIH